MSSRPRLGGGDDLVRRLVADTLGIRQRYQVPLKPVWQLLRQTSFLAHDDGRALRDVVLLLTPGTGRCIRDRPERRGNIRWPRRSRPGGFVRNPLPRIRADGIVVRFRFVRVRQSDHTHGQNCHEDDGTMSTTLNERRLHHRLQSIRHSTLAEPTGDEPQQRRGQHHSPALSHSAPCHGQEQIGIRTRAVTAAVEMPQDHGITRLFAKIDEARSR